MNLTLMLIAVALIALLALWFLALNRTNPLAPQKPKRHGGMRRHWKKVYLLPLGLARLTSWLPGGRYRPTVQFANIGEGTYSDGRKSYLPDAATTARYLLYKKGTDVDHCAITGAGDDPLGPSDDQADAGVPITLNLLGAVKGTVRVVTDGTVNDGDRVKCGATGFAAQAASTELSFGRAVIPSDCSKAAGDVITIIPCVPQKYVF